MSRAKEDGGWPDKFTQKYLNALAPRDRVYEKGERFTKGLLLRVQPSGLKTWRFVWARGKGITLGRYPLVTLEVARAECSLILQRIQQSEDPKPAYLRPATKRTQFDRINDIAVPYRAFYIKLKTRQGFENVRSLEVVETVLRDIGDWRIPQTDFARIRNYRDSLLTNNAARTINRKMQALHPLIVWARSKFHVWPAGDPFIDPMTGTALPPLPQGNRNRSERVRWISPDDEARLREYVAGRSDHFEVAVVVALGTGMRPGEIFSMRWQDVRANTIHVPKSKTGRGRYALMDEATKVVLDRWRKSNGNDTTVLGVQSVKRQWLAMQKALNITNVFGDCRHTYITRRRSEGMDWPTLGELVGHTEGEMTETYTFLDHELGLKADRPRIK